MRSTPPKSLSKVAREEWESVVNQLQRAGTLDRTARSAVEAHCRLWALFVDLARKSGRRKDGIVTVHAHNGVPGLTHHFKAMGMIAGKLQASYRQLGLTPGPANPDQFIAPPAASAGKPAGDSGLDLSPGPDDD